MLERTLAREVDPEKSSCGLALIYAEDARNSPVRSHLYKYNNSRAQVAEIGDLKRYVAHLLAVENVKSASCVDPERYDQALMH